MTDINVKRVSKDKFQNAIDDAQVTGYRIKTQGDNVAIMKKYGDKGSIFWHVVLLIFAPLIGNAIYAAHRYYNTGSELQIKVE